MLSIVFVNYKTSHQIEKSLNSIEKYEPDYKDYEFIVVDNNSDDEGFKKLNENHPYINLVYAEKNGGFAYGNNRGIEVAKGDIIFLLNPDTYVEDNAIQKLYKKMQDDDSISFIGPKLLYPDGTNQSFFEPKSHLTLWRLFCERFFLHRVFVHSKLFNGRFRTYMDYDKQCDVEQVSGAALMFRRDVIDKVGLMDENFFMYFEEGEWCYRAVVASLRLVYYPESKIVHEDGLISDGNWKRSTHDYLKSFKYYFEKTYGTGHYLLAYVLYLLGTMIRFLGLLVLGKKKAGFYFYYLRYMLGVKNE